MTYAEMADKLALWLNREGFASLTDQAGELIAMGQRRIHRECDLKAMEAVTALTVSSQSQTLPTDVLRVKNITLQVGQGTAELLGASLADVLRYSREDTPTRFAVVGRDIYFGPPPSQTFSATLVYFKPLDILSATATSNWISLNEPDLLLFAALMEASMFLKDDARAQIWEARYKDLKTNLENAESRMDKPYGSLQVRAR